MLALRREHPAWGGRKLRRRLLDLQVVEVPAASTITEILRRHGQLNERDGAGKPNIQRFEHAASNDLWQMDFKGHFSMTRGGRFHPLTVLDDYSRYSTITRGTRWGCEPATTNERKRCNANWSKYSAIIDCLVGC